MKKFHEPLLPGILDPVMHLVPQPPILDHRESRRLAEVGMARVTAATNPDWCDTAYTALVAVAGREVFVTSDDLWVALGADFMAHANPSALGSVFQRAARAGVIAPTGRFAPSGRAVAHQKQNRVWRSLCDGQEKP